MQASSVHTKTESITNLYIYLPQYELNGYMTKHDAGTAHANIVHRLRLNISLPYIKLITAINQTSDTNSKIIASLFIISLLSLAVEIFTALSSSRELSGTLKTSLICTNVSILGVTSALSQREIALSE